MTQEGGTTHRKSKFGSLQFHLQSICKKKDETSPAGGNPLFSPWGDVWLPCSASTPVLALSSSFDASVMISLPHQGVDVTRKREQGKVPFLSVCDTRHWGWVACNTSGSAWPRRYLHKGSERRSVEQRNVPKRRGRTEETSQVGTRKRGKQDQATACKSQAPPWPDALRKIGFVSVWVHQQDRGFKRDAAGCSIRYTRTLAVVKCHQKKSTTNCGECETGDSQGTVAC